MTSNLKLINELLLIRDDLEDLWETSCNNRLEQIIQNLEYLINKNIIQQLIGY